ncbi:hypothetical protein SJS53_13360 [Aeromonas caviae]|jgi:hypothetical protein|uniref:hypothetical protein n=1 Tax=Aeromonas TaxID=642 RepID=UPI0022E04994|nr:MULTISPECIES: hypothetical protein [Aeromonas]MDX7807685.1 hypothetical protein [Aeromonas caviae]
MLFGVISEGPTDQAVIENIICGILNDEDLCEEIQSLQPVKDCGKWGCGGWEKVIQYLSSEDFRDSFDYIDNVIVQIDTDVCHLSGFDVSLVDDDGKDVSLELFLDRVRERLIKAIDFGESGFYSSHEERIIFCITIHSTEIWLAKHHSKLKDYDEKRVKNGMYLLVEEVKRNVKNSGNYLTKEAGNEVVIKTYDNYDLLSRDFYNKKTRVKSVDDLRRCDISFRLFSTSIEHFR